MKNLKKLNKEEGKILINLARESIKSELIGQKLVVEEVIKERFSEKKGVFTTIYNYPEKKLKGCIGIPYPVYPLWEGVLRTAVDAAFNDPRFEPLKDLEEFSHIVVELTILTSPRLLKVPPDRYPEYIEIGKTGLMIEKGVSRGLLLPQVATEYNLTKEQFLRETCLKAGLHPDAWKEKDTKLYIFEGFKIKELYPFGEVEVETEG
jgi:hypothetical protein